MARNSGSDGICRIAAQAYYPTIKGGPSPAPATMYKCTEAGGCIADATGGYSTNAQCEASCARPPGPTKYACAFVPPNDYKCQASSTGTLSQSTCSSVCRAPGQTKYSCDSTTGTCAESPDGPFTSMSTCQNSCQAPVDQNYYCRFDYPSNYQCSQESFGTQSKSDCVNSCHAPSRYSCQTSTGTATCVADPSGEYTSESQCQTTCAAPSSNNYYCRYDYPSTYTCQVQPYGTLSKSSCAQTCRADAPTPAPTPAPVAGKYECQCINNQRTCVQNAVGTLGEVECLQNCGC